VVQILLSNDDGIDAIGLSTLRKALEGLGTIWVVAPQTEQSARSHGLTLHKPLRARPAGERAWAISGTPADCVYVALHGLVPVSIDVVISGINRGANLGNDTFYSGTVAAAREGALAGTPSMALSLVLEGDTHEPQWDAAAVVAREIVGRFIRSEPTEGTLINVNIPNLPADRQRGTRVVPLGDRRYLPQLDRRIDPRGKDYFWIGGPPIPASPDNLTDAGVVASGFTSVTPLRNDQTDPDGLASTREWTHG